MRTFPDANSWPQACAGDPSLAAWEGAWSICFAIASDDHTTVFQIEDGKVRPDSGSPAFTPSFTLAAPARVWDKFLQPIPPRHHHGIFAMHYRVPEFSIQGDQLAFMQHAHVVRRVLEVGKWMALGNPAPAPVSLAPRHGPRPMPPVTGGYVPVTVGGTTLQVYHETAGSGRDVLCMHTAGADGRQFHGLMADPRITAGHRLVAFDLPWHGKSPPPEGAIPGSWRLNTDLYVDLIMGFIAAAGLDRPIALGASMSGEICLELAYRHPEAFGGIIACEACDKIERRQTAWAAHPAVNQALFVPEWIRALCAPQSPAEYQEAIAWHYGQGGPPSSSATSPSTPATGTPASGSARSTPTAAVFSCSPANTTIPARWRHPRPPPPRFPACGSRPWTGSATSPSQKTRACSRNTCCRSWRS